MSSKEDIENKDLNSKAKRFKQDTNEKTDETDEKLDKFLDWCKSVGLFIDFNKAIYLVSFLAMDSTL